MNKLVLPATINPPRLRKDGSCGLSFDTRELTPEEILMIMGFRNTEGWVCFSPNEEDIDIPDEKAEVDSKSASERLRNVLFVLYKQKTEKGEYVGLFEPFRQTMMEKIIEGVKAKLDK